MSQRERHSEALLGIQLAEAERLGKGSPPSDEELALLLEGQLDSARRAEVLSHLAARPERYRQWLDLAELDATAQAQQPSGWAILTHGINNWLIDWRYAVGGIGAMAGVLLLVNQMAAPPLQTPQPVSSIVLSDAYNNSAEEAEAAPPPAAPQSATDQAGQQAERKLAERLALERSRELRAQSKMAAPEEISRRCAGLMHDSKKGQLCAVSLANGISELRWQIEDGIHTLDSVHEGVMQLEVSASHTWVALQTPSAIYVQATSDLLGDNQNRIQLPFGGATSTIRWKSETLTISVMQALGDSDEDATYHYHPASGELKRQ